MKSMTSADPVQQVLDRLEGVKKNGVGWHARCPVDGHGKGRGDKSQSLSVSRGDDDRVLLKCHAGCDIQEVLAAVGLKTKELFPQNGIRKEVVARYVYQDEEGNPLFQAVRTQPKGFFQQRWENGRWENGTKGVRRVLYRLPELLASTDTVYVVEGEKDVEGLRKLGLCATTNVGGAGTWRSEYSEVLRNRDVVILPDNDLPGQDHAAHVAKALDGIAASVKIVDLPDLIVGGDVSDWLTAGGTREELEQIASVTDVVQIDPTLPEIVVTHQHLRDVTAQSLEALSLTNDPPTIFRRAGTLSRVRWDELGSPVIELYSDQSLRGDMDRAADYLRHTREGTVPTYPPAAAVRDVLARPGWDFPTLEGITESPVLRANGSVLSVRGYDAATGLFYAPPSGLDVPPMPDPVTEADVAVARSLLEEVIEDFPFVDQCNRANALALILTPFLRPAIDGPVPMTIIDAPTKGTGKTLLAETAASITTGKGELLGAPVKEEEWQKLITSNLAAGVTHMIFDNLRGEIRSAALERALTAQHWSDRILGVSKLVRIPQRAIWIATANNAVIGGDLARRCIWVRLDAKMSRPWTGRSFHKPDLLKWVAENRGVLQVAALTLARSWYLAGCPKPSVEPLGKFEAWTRIVGGVLEHAGVEGFLGNQERLYDEMDESTGQWEAFLRAWLNVYGSEPVVVSTLIRRMYPEDGLADEGGQRLRSALPDELVDSHGKSPQGFAKRLGKALSRNKDSRHGQDGIRVIRGDEDLVMNTRTWKVVT